MGRHGPDGRRREPVPGQARTTNEQGLTEAELAAAEAELSSGLEELETAPEDLFAAALIPWHQADGQRVYAMTAYRRRSELPQERQPFVAMYARARKDMEWYEAEMARILVGMSPTGREDFLRRRHVLAGVGSAPVPPGLAERLRHKVAAYSRGEADPDEEQRVASAEED